MNDLLQKHCIPCEGGTTPMRAGEYETYLKMIDGWEVVDES